MFLSAGGAKLAGAPSTIQVFDAIGFGQWLRYAVAIAEITGGILILMPKTVAWGAVLLFAVMIGAVCSHLFVLGGSPALAGVFLLLTGFVAWMYRHQFNQH